MKKKISAKIIADSVNPYGDRITTFILTYPRIIHGELMTHRMFSRNAASSRAIPFEKMVKDIEENPFIPIAWQSKHSGMQGTDYLIGNSEIKLLRNKWIEAKDLAVQQAKLLHNSNVTKQLCNRLLEPFQWMTTLVTATEFENFFELRCPKYKDLFSDKTFRSWKDLQDSVKDLDITVKALSEASIFDKFRMNTSQAEIHIQALAEAMWDARNERVPTELKEGEWHIPFGDRFDETKLEVLSNNKISEKDEEIFGMNLADDWTDILVKISTARAARISYTTHDGEIDYEKDVKLHDMLLESKHASAFEHCAKCKLDGKYANFTGWQSYRNTLNI